ncbi:MAG: DNA alkylation repair protein [Candidatus Sabulitectum sp.]|nr:DNA alkylation repair protein [Candidatus Sabulitectum sp.]
MNKVEEVISELKKLADPVRAAHSQKFFKTGPGEYGEGDLFLGLRVPQTRKLVKTFRGLELQAMEKLLQSKWHEARLFALLSMVDAFKRGSDKEKEGIFKLYTGNSDRVNGWDLVDSSAPHIAGAYLWDKNRQPLYDFAVSDSLWKRRIAIISTQHFIRNNSFNDTLKIADMLLDDKEDLIHKAVGWMLREVGNRNTEREEKFLKLRYMKMPRTMLRYAIEKFEPGRRKMYLKGLI